MFLESYSAFSDDKYPINKLARQSVTYNAYYLYWRENLFERVMRLFVWENTGEVKPKEIEQRLILAGHCGITKIKKESELTAMYGTFYGVTKYIDEWKHYMVRCPIFAGQRTIGKDVVVIDNCALRNPIYPLIHHYATLLAHTEVTFADVMINARDAGGIPVATTEKQKQSIKEYQGKIFNGEYGVITDLANMGTQYVGSDRKTYQSVQDILIAREKLLKSFYSDIGVRSAFEKRSNSIEAEVEADTSLLLVNISDMIASREAGADAVNKMFGTNWNVHIAKEIDYGIENERIQFDTATNTHMIDVQKVVNDNIKEGRNEENS